MEAPKDISQLTEAELAELSLEADGRELARQPVAERWWIVAIIATTVIIVLMGLIGMAKGVGETRRAIQEGRTKSNYVMGYSEDRPEPGS